MKTGMTVTELANTLKAEASTKRDFIVDPRALTMTPEATLAGLPLELDSTIRPFAHGQFSDFTKIPKRYYDRMLVEDPGLLATNVNRWLQDQERPRMVRTIGESHETRALVSSAFRPLDNFQLAGAVLPTLAKKGAEIVSCDITETRFYLKAILPTRELEVKGSRRTGDLVQSGVSISNSEVGNGSLRVEPYDLYIACLNGMMSMHSLRRYHIGRRQELEDQVAEVLKDSTKEQLDKGFWASVSDVVEAAFDEELFQARVDMASETTGRQITSSNIPKVVEVTRDRLGITGEHQDTILNHLIRGGDLSQWGLINAVTRSAEDVESYDLATEFERAGGKLVEMDQNDWSRLAEAA